MELNNSLYVSGVVDDGECCQRVADADAQFWTVYRRKKDGLSEAIANFNDRDSAEKAIEMVALIKPEAVHWSELRSADFSPAQEGRIKVSGFDWLDWNQLSALGLIWRINTEILHPMGLALFRNTNNGASGGALIAPDGHWSYEPDADEGQ